MLHRYNNQAIAKAFSGIYIVGYIVSHGLIAFTLLFMIVPAQCRIVAPMLCTNVGGLYILSVYIVVVMQEISYQSQSSKE